MVVSLHVGPGNPPRSSRSRESSHLRSHVSSTRLSGRQLAGKCRAPPVSVPRLWDKLSPAAPAGPQCWGRNSDLHSEGFPDRALSSAPETPLVPLQERGGPVLFPVLVTGAKDDVQRLILIFFEIGSQHEILAGLNPDLAAALLQPPER